MADLISSAITSAEQKVEQNGFELPTDGLYEKTQMILHGITDTFQCNQEIVLVSMFVAMGTAAGKNTSIFDGKYHNNTSLFTGLISPSGTNKSVPLREVFRPLRLRNAASYQAYKDALKEWKQAGNDGTMPRPTWKQIIISDCTPEARNKALSDNDGGLVVVSDELRTFLCNLNRYHGGDDVTSLLSVYDGDDIINNRKSEDSTLIEKPFLSLIGGIQPDVVFSTFGSDLLAGSGFNQRFLFVFPDEVRNTHYIERRLDVSVQNDWQNMIDSALDADGVELIIRGNVKDMYVQYYNELQDRKNEAPDYMKAVFSKFQIIVERLAGIVHLLNENTSELISAQEMGFAIRMMPYFERTAKKVYDLINGNLTSHTSKKDLIKNVWSEFQCKNQSALAEALGVTQQYISKCLKI
jgi:hypothetical protein